jgi:hypothetical protein
MQDQPTPGEMLKTVAEFLRSAFTQEAQPHIAYQVRVAANVLDLVARELAIGPLENTLEAERLRAITTLAKLSIDQPGYSGYRAALADRDGLAIL